MRQPSIREQIRYAVKRYETQLKTTPTHIFLNPEAWKKCPRFFRMCALRDLAPNLWEKEGCGFCCREWQHLFLLCAEDSGCLRGAFDIRRYPNDGKNVWRNYRRARFTYCPFCGAEARPSPETLFQNREVERRR